MDATAATVVSCPQGIPTLLLLRDGQEVGRQVGALPGHALRRWINQELQRRA